MIISSKNCIIHFIINLEDNCFQTFHFGGSWCYFPSDLQSQIQFYDDGEKYRTLRPVHKG